MPRPVAPPAQTPLTGEETVRIVQNGAPVLAKTADLKGQKGDTGAIGPIGPAGPASTVPGPQGLAGTPRRVERYSAAAGATVTFSPAFGAPPIVLAEATWTTPTGGPQMVTGLATGITAAGFTVASVVRSRGTLLLSSGPFEAAPAGTTASFTVIGS